MKDLAVGYSLHGVHRDDLEMLIGGYPIKREGSQGQNKTFVIALKLAQFYFLKRTGSKTTPILLLDDVFDKLDAQRVEQIVKIVAGDEFGQIFLTDTNRDHLDRILSSSSLDYRLFMLITATLCQRRLPMFKRDVQTLADILQKCLRQDGLETPLQQKRLIDSWDKVVGKIIAGYTAESYQEPDVVRQDS